MLNSKGESLNSKFKMSYSILFNALSSQIIELEDIMKKSFGENTNYVVLKDIKKKKEAIWKKLEDSKIQCEFVEIEEIPPISKFKEDVDQLYELSGRFYSKPACGKTISLPRFMQIIDDQYSYHFALVTDKDKGTGKQSGVNYYKGYIFKSNSVDSIAQLPILIDGKEHRPSLIQGNGGKFTHSKYTVEISPSSITVVYQAPLSLGKNPRDIDMIEETETFVKYFKSGKVKPLDMEFYDKDVKEQQVILESVRDQVEKSKCYMCEKKDFHISSLRNKGDLE